MCKQHELTSTLLFQQKETMMSVTGQKDETFRSVIRGHWLPLLILIVPINIAVGVWVLDFPWFAFVSAVPITAAVIGWIYRPRHVYVIWLGAILILWISMGLWGRYNDPGPDETVMSLILEAIIWMALGVALPLWAARTISLWRNE
jgi:hypothetical protein